MNDLNIKEIYQEEKQKAILNYLSKNAYNMCRKPVGRIKHAFVEPGAHYKAELWDWDSFFAMEALMDITEKMKDQDGFDYSEKKSLVMECGKGCIMNFLDEQMVDGYIPIGLFAREEGRSFFQEKYDNGEKMNQIKPILAQFSLLVCEYCNDYTWLEVDKLEKYFEYYQREQFNERTGMYVWQNDLMVGVDNNPAVFFRPALSSADIYLNTFMYVELSAFAAILRKLGKNDKANLYEQKAETLKNVINNEMYDERDAFYYSQDVIRDTTIAEMGYHKRFPMEYKGLPIKVRSWVGLMPLWAGIPTAEQAADMIKKNFNDDTLFCEAGIRSLAKNEKMFDERSSSNPSNHLGPVWIINNVIVWKGLKKYGFEKLAEELRRKTIDLLGDNVIQDGGFYESYTGEGTHMLYLGFLSWNCLITEMLDEIGL